MDKFLKRQMFFMLLIMVVTVTGAFCSSYAFFHQTSEGKEQVVEAGNLNISYEGGSTINRDLLPMSDEDGQNTTPYAFEISNTGTLPADYTLYIRDLTETDEAGEPLDHSYIRISIDGGLASYLSDYEKDGKNGDVYHGVLNVSGSDKTKKHEVRLWIDEEAPTDIIDKVINLKLEVIGLVRES